MAVTTTARLGVTRWSAGTDPFTRAQMDASMAALEANAAMFLEDTLALRPAAGKAGRLYRVTDAAAEAPTVFWDTGSAWVEIRPDLSSYATDAALTSGLAGKSATGHAHAASDVTSGVFAVARLGTGASGSNFLRGDGVFASPAAGALTGLTDVVITAVAANHFLQWDVATSKWINSTITTAEVTGLDTALSGKAASSHSHAIGDLPVATSGTSNATQLVRADDSRLSNARTPSAHTHTKAEVTDFAHSHLIGDLPVATSGTSNATQLVRADDARLSDARTPSAHSHAIGDLPVATSGTSNATQLVRADDARLSNARTPTTHSHLIADLPVATSGTSNATELVRADDSRLSNARTPSAHNHPISEITSLQGALDAKAPLASPTFTGTTTVDVLAVTGNGTVGNGNQDVLLQQSLLVETDTRNLTLTYSSGKLSTIVEKDGATTVLTTTMGYTGEKLTTVTEVGGGKTVVTTLVYTGEDITSTTRSVT